MTLSRWSCPPEAWLQLPIGGGRGAHVAHAALRALNLAIERAIREGRPERQAALGTFT
jgi:hypothetical protein